MTNYVLAADLGLTEPEDFAGRRIRFADEAMAIGRTFYLRHDGRRLWVRDCDSEFAYSDPHDQIMEWLRSGKFVVAAPLTVAIDVEAAREVTR